MSSVFGCEALVSICTNAESVAELLLELPLADGVDCGFEACFSTLVFPSGDGGVGRETLSAPLILLPSGSGLTSRFLSV